MDPWFPGWTTTPFDFFAGMVFVIAFAGGHVAFGVRLYWASTVPRRVLEEIFREASLVAKPTLERFAKYRRSISSPDMLNPMKFANKTPRSRSPTKEMNTIPKFNPGPRSPVNPGPTTTAVRFSPPATPPATPACGSHVIDIRAAGCGVSV